MPGMIKTTVIVLLLGAMHWTVQAQNPPVNPDSALLNTLGRLKGARLPLQEALRLAQNNATGLRTAEAGQRAAEGAVRRERGNFDPEYFLAWNRQDQQLPSASFFAGADVLKTVQSDGSTGLRWSLPTGTSLQLSLNSNRMESNSAFAFLNPQNTLFGNLSVRQPLMGGFAATARKNLERADHDLAAARARFEQQTLVTRAVVESYYWDLYQAERDLAVQQLTVDQARAFLQEATLRAGAGLIGPVQVANARTFLAQQELLALDLEERCTRVSDQLASQIGSRPGEGFERFIAVDEPPADFPVVDEERLVRQAIEGNLDLRAAQYDIAARQVLAQAASWESLPQIDLLGSLGGSGLSGVPNEVIFAGDTLRTTVRGSMSHALDQAVRREYPAWMVGLSVQLPIGMRRGRGEQQRLQAEANQAEQQRIAAARSLEELVRANYRELVKGAARIQVARAGVEAAHEQVRVGMIEFQNGRSTAFELTRLAADLASAQQRYSEALVRRAKAAAALATLTSGAFTGGSVQR